MGRKVNRRGVTEARLFGAYQRVTDLRYRQDLTSAELTAHGVEASSAVEQYETELAALGGDADEILSRVRAREREWQR